MLVSKAARRYATALLETAKEQKVVDPILKDILFVKNTIDGSKELIAFLKSPIIKPDDKKAALSTLFSKEVNKLTAEFISLIASKERAAILHEITVAFIHQYNQYAGIIEVEVRTATSLDAKQVTNLKKALENSTSKKVELDLKEQPELKGGLMVKIDDTVIDGTVKHKLEQLQQTFLETSMELN
ncbi:MAG: ATP synthase F1 subunit delta [Balneola sp.]|nr:MAG: ATP synthase F1 subunit delta [Balneola sp.]